MRYPALVPIFGVLSSTFLCAAGPDKASIDLKVEAGTPVRVYLTKRLSSRLNEPVSAKVLEPVYAFDRIVIPAGTEVSGTVVHLDSAPKMERAFSMLNGDFTPLHSAEVQFEKARLPDGRQLSLSTYQSLGLPLVVSAAPPPKPKKAKSNAPQQANQTGLRATAKHMAATELQNQINARTYGMADILRGPGKLERLEDFLMAKLPYHPQWVRKGTRYDAVLRSALDMGPMEVNAESLKWLGSPIPDGAQVQARLLNPLSSDKTPQGQHFSAKLMQPLFSPEKHLLLPEGASLEGSVTQVRPAKFFHRSGQLRFRFDKVQLGDSALKAEAQINAIEGDGKADLKVDSEGGVKATESKARLLNPVIAALIAAKSIDNDAGKLNPGQNYGGRALGGASGFGLAGTLASLGSKYIGSTLGFYGLGWSVYRNVIARGPDVIFRENTAMNVRFGVRAK